MSANKTFQLLERFTGHGFYTIKGTYQEQSAVGDSSAKCEHGCPKLIVIIVRSQNRKNPGGHFNFICTGGVATGL